jgi:hypothetical protein
MMWYFAEVWIVFEHAKLLIDEYIKIKNYEQNLFMGYRRRMERV